MDLRTFSKSQTNGQYKRTRSPGGSFNFKNLKELDLVQLCETQKTYLNNPLFKNIPHVGPFLHIVICYICVFVYLYFCICTFDTWEYNFWYPHTKLFSKIYYMLGLSGSSSFAVFVYLFFVYLYFCICAYGTWEHNFWYPWTILFWKIYHMLGLSSTWHDHLVYLCICPNGWKWVKMGENRFSAKNGS